MRNRVCVGFQLFVGLMWVLGVTWAWLRIAGLAERNSTMAVLVYWGGLLLGPILLVAGTLWLVAIARHRSEASVVAGIGSLAVSLQSVLWVGPLVVESLQRHNNGLAALCVGFIGISVLSSVVAYVLYRNVRSADTPASLA